MDPNGKSNTSTALVRKRTDTEIMPPPPPVKKIKRPRKVLDEDTYTETLSHIITRDFFPGLLESEVQQEYLDAVESKDDAWISSASQRLQRVMTPARPGSAPPLESGSAPPAQGKPKVDATKMNLGTFQATYTSEDNESFYKVIDKQNQKKADKYAWLWRGNKLPSKRQLKQKEVEARRGSDRLITYQRAEFDDRPAMPDTWDSVPNNQLMFFPDGVEEQNASSRRRETSTAGAPPPRAVLANTRMPEKPIPGLTEPDKAVPPSPSLSAIRDALNSKTRSEYQESSIGGSETPRVNGYAFVEDEEPEEELDQKPAKIDLGPGDSAPNPFNLKEASEREALHKRMLERIAESRRTSARIGMTGKEGSTPTPRYPSSPRVTGGLTPAAQRLWSNIRPGGGTPSRTPIRMQTPTTPLIQPQKPKPGSKPKHGADI